LSKVQTKFKEFVNNNNNKKTLISNTNLIGSSRSTFMTTKYRSGKENSKEKKTMKQKGKRTRIVMNGGWGEVSEEMSGLGDRSKTEKDLPQSREESRRR
jgi:hypothetical protein